MSKLIPRRTIDAIRNVVDVALDVVGISCTLWIPTTGSHNTAETLDVWMEQDDLTYTRYSTLVYVDWKPSTRKLRKLGLFTEDSLPILARFANKLTALEGSNTGQLLEVDIPIRSYFQVAPEFVPNDYNDVEEFEIVDEVIDGIHDAVLTKLYLVAPRRVKQ